MYVCVCIVCISVYLMNMCVLYVLLVYTCIACICMYCLYCVYSVYLYVSACIVCIGNIVCMCMYCLYMSVYLETFFQIHTHTCTYIHTYNTNKIQICSKCMYVYVFSGKYIIQTAGFTYIQIQKCRIPDGCGGTGLGSNLNSCAPQHWHFPAAGRRQGFELEKTASESAGVMTPPGRDRDGLRSL